MRYQLTPINSRPWLLNGLSLRLIESHYENHYGEALRRLNAITEQLESLDLDNSPRVVLRQHGVRRWKADRNARPGPHPRLRVSGSLAQ